MYAVVLLAVLASPAPATEKPERWIPLPSNPALEIYGREDSTGQFRYHRMRPAEPPVVNYGVSLPPVTASGPSHDLRGTDDDVSAELVREALSSGDAVPVGEAESASGTTCGHGDCPDGRCEKKKPTIDGETAWAAFRAWCSGAEGRKVAGFVVGLLILFAVLAFLLFLLVAIVVGRLIIRRFFP